MGILAHFSKQTFTKKRHFFWEVIIWSKLEVIIWSKLGASLKRQLGADNNFQIFSAQFFPKQMCWNPYF